MPRYGNEPESNGKRRDVVFAAVVVLLAFTTTYASAPTQQTIANVLQASVLRPFIATQERLRDARRRAGEIDVLTARMDSLTAILATQAALFDENRTLRSLLGLAERGGPRFVPATVLRPGTPGSRSMFIVDVGADHGVPQGAPVVSPRGLVGVIREVRSQTAVGLDWSHPDFRASAMLVDGTTYGILSPRRGDFREDDRLILRGTAYTTNILPGSRVLTSGLGGVFPRGIPVGKIGELLESEGEWRKSFWVEAMVEPGSVTHVLVLTEGSEGDVSGAWPVDSVTMREEAISAERSGTAGRGDARDPGS